MKSTNPLLELVRNDIPGIFNEVDILKRHKARFLHALNKGSILPPYEILIHPSASCNLQCQWCIGGRVLDEQDTQKEAGRLPNKLVNPENMEKLIRGIIAYEKDGFKVENVSFSGITGEPMTAKKSLALAVDLLAQNNRRIGIFSNSVLIDDDLIQTLLKMNYINISLDAATPKTYSILKYSGKPEGETLYLRLLDNIKKLVKARSESKESKLEINASFILYPSNYKEIFETAKMLKDIGVRTLRMKQDNSGKMLLTESQMKEAEVLFTKIEAICDDHFRFIKIHKLNDPSEMLRTFDKCVIADLIGAVGSDGNVYPCNYHACVGGRTYGNAFEKPFGEVWEGEERENIKKLLPKICPSVCDPFKNRSNRLFAAIKKCQEEQGSEQTERYIEEIINLV